jgi:hypothetical protein
MSVESAPKCPLLLDGADGSVHVLIADSHRMNTQLLASALEVDEFDGQ